MELKQNNTYIFTQINISYPTPWKGKVLEITETSIYIENLDQNLKHRYSLEKFNNDLKAIELIHDFHKSIVDAIKEIHKQPIEFKKFEEYKPYPPKPCRTIGPCFCDGSCYKTPSTTGWINFLKG